ncbi:MAG: hypothetical protein IIA82_05725 [Thaumarchaeota archaeon]|nr:hypothetical protein [Nitrososphaerota archaeon]
MTLAWHDRSQYGVTLRTKIKELEKEYKKARDIQLKLKIAHSITYIIQTLACLIRDEKNVENRLQKLEEMLK